MGFYNILLACAAIALMFGAKHATADGETGTCETLKTKEDCCQNTTCIYVECDDAAENSTKKHMVCHESTWNANETCKNNTFEQKCNRTESITTSLAPKVTTTLAPTAAPVDECETIGNNQTLCCNKSSICEFIQCNSTDTTVTELHKGCHKINATLTSICKDATDSDLCKEIPTTTQAPTTPAPTPKANTTTQAQAPVSTPAPAPDSCEGFTANASACCLQTGCMFIMCQEKGDKKGPHLGCHNSATNLTQFCTADTSRNACSADAWGPQSNTAGDTSPHGQHFDGASFIGGSVLCLGLLAIVFFGLKFYRARADKNYHTL